MAQVQIQFSSKPIAAPPPINPAPKCPVSHAFPVLLSCFIMAANAGFVNAIFLESVYGTSVSHLTGTTTRAAAQFANGRYDLMFRNLGIVFFFFTGSALNAFIVGDSQMRMVQNYGFAILLEAVLLILPIFIPTTSRLNLNIAVYIIACACGLQNAMLTIYGTAIVRTTHVTGLVTDVGILCGLYIRDLIFLRKVRKEGMWKLKIMIPLYLGFFTGGTLGMICMDRMPKNYALVIPSVITAWVGIGFLILRTIHNRKEAAKALMEAERLRRLREEQEREEEMFEEECQDSGEDGEFNGGYEGRPSVDDDLEMEKFEMEDRSEKRESTNGNPGAGDNK